MEENRLCWTFLPWNILYLLWNMIFVSKFLYDFSYFPCKNNLFWIIAATLDSKSKLSLYIGTLIRAHSWSQLNRNHLFVIRTWHGKWFFLRASLVLTDTTLQMYKAILWWVYTLKDEKLWKNNVLWP